MSRGYTTVLIYFVLLLVLGIAVTYDLGRWRQEEGDRLFHTDDLQRAIARWTSNSPFFADVPRLAFNRGVARYRSGESAKAAEEFRRAAKVTDAALRHEALYNLGTLLLKQGSEANASDRSAARQQLAEALTHLQAAAALDPSDADARHNLAIAQAGLAALDPGRPAGMKNPPSLPTPEAEKKGDAAAKTPGQQGKGAGKPGEATDKDSPEGKRRRSPEISRENALRMLDDARGREALRSEVAADRRHGQLTAPDKDW